MSEAIPFADAANIAISIHQEADKRLRLRDPSWAQYIAEARNRYVQLLNARPDDPQILFCLGTSYLMAGESAMAWMILERLHDKADATFDALNNIGVAYRQQHHNAQAMRWYEKALELKPDEPDVLANLTSLHVNEGHPEKGIPHGEKCLSIRPDHPQAIWNLALLYLESGEYDKGFALYNRGFETKDRLERTYVDSRGLNVPFWWNDGEDTSDKTIVIHDSQGQGDGLLALQLIPCILPRFKKVILDIHYKFYEEVVRAFPTCTVYPTRKEEPVWAASEVIDYKQDALSLFQWFHMERGKHCGWLKPLPDKKAMAEKMVSAWQKARGEKGRKRIGIHWTGGRHSTRIDLRSIPLPLWQPIMDLPVTLVSLQYTDSALRDLAPYADRIFHCHGMVGEKNADLGLNIALSSVCDLVVSVNTTAIHIAGSMNQPGITLTPFGRAWRYGRGDTVPFYQSIQQINQAEGEDWAGPMAEAAKRVGDFL